MCDRLASEGPASYLNKSEDRAIKKELYKGNSKKRYRTIIMQRKEGKVSKNPRRISWAECVQLCMYWSE